MEHAIATRDIDKMRNERNFLRLLTVLLVIGIIATTSTTFYGQVAQMTHLLPSGAQKPYTIGRGYTDKSYATDWAYDVVSLWANVTPENIAHNKERLLKLADAEGNVALRTELDVAERRIKQDSISTTWSPIDAEVNLEKKYVIWRGFVKTYLNNVPTTNVERKIVVEYHVSNAGHIFLRSLKELKIEAAK